MNKNPLLQKLSPNEGSSFLIHRFESPYFESPWHFHPEIEIVLCDGGYGQKFIGNHISDYEKGDLILLGSNLPHWFKADDNFYKKEEQKEKPASLVVQFNENLLAQNGQLLELENIFGLLQKAKHGVEFLGSGKKEFAVELQYLLKQGSFEKYLGLIKLLHKMANYSQIRLLSDFEMVGLNSKESDRLSLVFDYVLKNYKNIITLPEVAEILNLNESAFCRFFKQRTQKTFVEFVNEIRLNQACKLLKNSKLTILDICFEVGFNNLSNFNRQFKKQIGKSPMEYRK